MKVTAFPFYTPPFPEYNVAQAAAIPFLDKDVNIVVSFSTAAGKTVLAECCFAYHLQTNSECRVAYVCPFRSLAAEKYKEWMEEFQLSRFGLVLGTGDSSAGIKEHEAARLVLATLESFDAKTRSPHWRDFMSSMACVVYDEAHLLGDKGRGGALESAMMRFSSINPSARMVLLSATMGNSMEVARWVKSLNGKPTKNVTSNWKPTEVRTQFVVAEGYNEKVEEAVKIASNSVGKKTIVFVHSKVTGADILKRLRSMGVRSAFHNASVTVGKRKKIEDAFGDSSSGLDVLVSTSTLGAGVNLS